MTVPYDTSCFSLTLGSSDANPFKECHGFCSGSIPLDSNNFLKYSICFFKGLTVTGETVEIRKSAEGTNTLSETDSAWKPAVDGVASFDGLTSGTKYTFTARVKATDGHKAGTESTLDVTTSAEGVTLDGTLTWKSANIITVGSEAGLAGLKAGDDITERVDVGGNNKFKDASTETEIAAVNPTKTKYTVVGDTGALTTNTKVAVKISVTTTSGTTYTGETEVIVLVKAAKPVVTLSTEITTFDAGKIKIATPTTLPEGLQYQKTTTNSAPSGGTWQEVAAARFTGGFKAEGDSTDFTAGDYVFFQIAAKNASAEGGWAASDISAGVEVKANNIGKTVKFSVVSLTNDAFNKGNGSNDGKAPGVGWPALSDIETGLTFGTGVPSAAEDGTTTLTYTANGSLKYYEFADNGAGTMGEADAKGYYLPCIVAADGNIVSSLGSTFKVDGLVRGGNTGVGTYNVSGNIVYNTFIAGKTALVYLLRVADKDKNMASTKKVTFTIGDTTKEVIVIDYSKVTLS